MSSGLLNLVVAVLAVGVTDAGHHRYYKNHGYSMPAAPAPMVRAAPPTQSIAELVVGDARFSTLLAAVQAAELVDVLAGEGTFTVFAPTNDAFAKVPSDALTALLADKDALTKVLTRHVLGSQILAEDIPLGKTVVPTLAEEDITVTNDCRGVTINSSAGESTVILTNVMATNGVVHAVDTVF